MGAAAEFQRIGLLVRALARTVELAHRDHAHLVAVFLAKQRLRAKTTSIVGGHDARFHRRILADEIVHLGFDLRDFLGRHRLVMAEIEAQPVMRVQRAALCHMIAKRAAQRLVQQVGGRVVGADRPTPCMFDLQLRRLPARDLAHGHFADMDEDPAGFLRIRDPHQTAFGPDRAGIADLTTGFGVERRLVDDELHRLAFLGRLDLGPVADQRQDLPFGAFGVIAQKFGRAVFFAQFEPDRGILGLARTGPCSPRLTLLFGHGGVETGNIDRTPLFAQRILRQVEREAVSVVKLERRLARQVRTFGQLGKLIVQQPQATVQRLAEAGFLGQKRFLDHRLGPAKLGVSRAHLADKRGHQLVHDRVLRPQHMRVTHGAAHDPAQHIAAPLVRGHHPIRQQERGRAQVIRDHPVMDLARPVRIGTGRMGRGLDQRPHQVGVVIVMLALQKRADPFQPHAGIDRLHVEIAHGAVLELLVLHEDEVPDLDEAVAVFLGGTGRAAPDPVAVIEEDLGAGAAGAGRAHAPEIVVGRDADDAVVGKARDLLPDLRRLVIGVIDSDQQLVLRDAEIPGQQLPCEGDGVGLEVIAEAEIPQHLEEGMMARRIADIVQIVMLAARAHAFLRRGGALIIALLDPGEAVLELNHAGIGEHQRRIVARHQRRGGHDLVPVALEEIEIGRADIVKAWHGFPRGWSP